jgi:hypothetical protein
LRYLIAFTASKRSLSAPAFSKTHRFVLYDVRLTRIGIDFFYSLPVPIVLADVKKTRPAFDQGFNKVKALCSDNRITYINGVAATVGIDTVLSLQMCRQQPGSQSFYLLATKRSKYFSSKNFHYENQNENHGHFYIQYSIVFKW